MYQAYAHVWTADYCYWNPVGAPTETKDAALDQARMEADRFWPREHTRWCLFMSRIVVRENGGRLPYA